MGSFQAPMGTQSIAMLETSCGYLLQELQKIWDEVGEEQLERDKVLLDLEQECLEVYRRKVDNANMSRARLHQELADSEAELTHLLLSLGERSLPGRPEKMEGTLKEQLGSIAPALHEMRMRKGERVKQFRAVQLQIQKISAEIAGQSEYDDSLPNVTVDENDLSLKKLEEYQMEHQRLHKEKSERLERVKSYISTIQNLSATLGMDPSMIITKVHPSLNELSGLSKNISDRILAKLDSTVESLVAEKRSRIEKLHHLGNALANLWNLMDTPDSDRQPFSHVTGSVSLADISTPGSLTTAMIQQAEAEVERLDQLKASKMKELFVKKQTELQEICSRSHMEIPGRLQMDAIINLINRGEMDYDDLLTSMDEQIQRAEEEASSRKTIMEKVEKWALARDEERWLEEYNMDENRYSVSRGAHKNLKRAERARVMVNKIPALVESLIAKTKIWEDERKKIFVYDEVPLLALLEDYNMSRREKEEEKQRQKEKKKAQNQGVVLQDNVFVTRPGTSFRRASDPSVDGGYNNGQGLSFMKEGKKSNGLKKYSRNRFECHPGDDQASIISTIPSPLSR